MIPRKADMGWMLWALLLVTVAGAQEICRSVLQQPYLLFGTKTAYEYSFQSPISAYSNFHEVAGCTPIAFWMLNRHGAHNPGADEVDPLSNLTNLKNNVISNYRSNSFGNNLRICSADVSLLEKWQWNGRHVADFADEITTDGYLATQRLAKAWKSKYPQLFSRRSNDYLFKYANDRKSSTSYKAFIDGIFEDLADSLELPKENNEEIVQPYKYCQAWKNEVDDNNETLSQRRIFESKEEYKQMLTNVSLRLGFTYDIEPQILRNMYDMCRYNKAWNIAAISPWCSFFTKQDLMRLEYAEDLETYYKYGYGTELNKKVGCSYVKDMMDFFTKHVDNEQPQKPRVMVHFTESPAILLALGAMGARKDLAPLTGDNYHSGPIETRQWSSSLISPYNANLAAALYKCTLNGNFQIKEQYQVLFFENQRPLNFEGCKVGLCEWSKVSKQLGEVATSCTKEACNGAPKLGQVTALSLAALPLILQIIYSKVSL